MVGMDICFFMEHSGLYGTLYPNAIIGKKWKKKMDG